MASPPSSPDDVIAQIARELDAIQPATLSSPQRWCSHEEGLARDRRGSLHRRPVRLAAAGACSIGAAAAVFVAMSSSSGPAGPSEASALPIFDEPSVDASSIRAATPSLDKDGAAYEDARAIDTASGTGYVMTARDGKICLALPDPGDGYGEACSTRERVEQRGLHIQLVSPKVSYFLAVVPTGTTAAELHKADGDTEPLDVANGTITASATGRAEVTYRTPSQQVRIALGSSVRCFVVHAGDTQQQLDNYEKLLQVPPCSRPNTPAAP